MNSADVDELLKQLRNDEGVWLLDLPADLRTFCGHAVQLTITTQIIDGWFQWMKKLTPPPSAKELDLARTILCNLSTVLEKSEQSFMHYIASEPDTLQVVDSPQIWIDRSILDVDGRRRWAFVVHRTDWPDFGWHIEFDELDCLEVWAGD